MADYVPRDAIDAALKNTADEVTKLVPSDANASAYQYVGALVRTVIAFEAGRGAGWAADVSGNEATWLGMVATGMVVLGWSLLSKKFAAWRTNQVAKASGAASAQATAAAGTATVIAVEPPPNKI